MKTLIAAAPAPECRFSVVIPVCDEAAHLPAALEAFARQIDCRNRPLDPKIFELIILANNCRDDSARIARDWQRRHAHINCHVAEISLPPNRANVGYVRRRLMNEAFRRLTLNRADGIIATTDGDTRVAPDWIARTIEEIRRGADAVGGRILIEAAELAAMNEKARRFHLLDEEYRLLAAELEGYLDRFYHDDFPRHHQHFNGSFAVTTEAFRRAGGVPRVPFLEDVAFYHALLRVDARVRHSPRVRVYTSGRQTGRSAVGLSFQINEWCKLGECGARLWVEPAAVFEKKIRARRRLRELWRAARDGERPPSKAVRRLARLLYVPPQFVFRQLQAAQTFGALLEKIYTRQNETRKWHRRNPPHRVETAIADLKKKLEKMRAENHLYKTTAH